MSQTTNTIVRPSLTSVTYGSKSETYRIHPNGGGRVGSNALVASTVYVGPKAMIRGRAVVSGMVRLFDNALIEEDAVVTGMVTLRQTASIGGRAVVRDGVNLAGDARADGDVSVLGNARLQSFAHVSKGQVINCTVA